MVERFIREPLRELRGLSMRTRRVHVSSNTARAVIGSDSDHRITQTLFSQAHFAQPVGALQIFGNAPWQSLAVLHASPLGGDALLVAVAAETEVAVAVAVAVAAAFSAGGVGAGAADVAALADASVVSPCAGVFPPPHPTRMTPREKQLIPSHAIFIFSASRGSNATRTQVPRVARM